MMKALIRIFGVVAVLAILAIAAGIMFADRGIKLAVEELGPRVTGTRVRLDEVDLSLTEGRGSLRGMEIGNPSGFSSPNAFSLGQIQVELDAGSLTTDTLIIHSLHILSPEITYEYGRSGSNLEALQRNIRRVLNAGSEGGSSSGDISTSSETGARKIIIRDFLFENASVHYRNTLLGDQGADLNLPAIHLTGIGEKTDGATAAEIGNQLMARINRETLETLSKEGLLKGVTDRLDKDLTDKLEKEKGKLKGILGDFEDKL